MNKFETIKKKYEDAQAVKERLRADVSKLSDRNKVLNAEAQELAENGDTDGYMVKKAEADRAGAELYVKQMQLKKADNPVTPEEAEAAWNEYKKKAEKELQSAWKEYTQKRRELADSLKRVMSVQSAMLSTREQCALFITGDFSKALTMSHDFKCYLVNADAIVHDRAFLRRTETISVSDDQYIGLLTGLQQSV